MKYLVIFLVLCAAAFADLKVMTYNVQVDFLNNWGDRKKKIVRNIRSEDPDIIGLQEPKYHQLKYITEYLETYECLGEGRNGGLNGEYSPILYKRDRFKILDYGIWDLPGGLWPRICTWAKFRDLRTDEVFYFYNTHLSVTSSNARIKSAKIIMERMQYPAILTGDMNDTPYSDTITWFKKQGLKDSLHEWKIDYIFYSQEFEVVESEIVKKKGSDHYPITAILR